MLLLLLSGLQRRRKSSLACAKQAVLQGVCADIPVLACRHDFTVVETIDFFADEEDELPGPMTRADVLLLNKAGQGGEDEPDEAAAEDGATVRMVYVCIF